jgi:hypothetical protein
MVTILPSHCLATIGEYTHPFMKYTAAMGSSAMIYIPSFIKTGSGTEKLMGGFTDTQTA